MIKIRMGVFETNSSSTHSLTMCTKEDFINFQRGNLVLNKNEWGEPWKNYPKLIPVSSLRDIGKDLHKRYYNNASYDLNWDKLSDSELIKFFEDYGSIQTSEYETDYLEYFEEEFTTPGGETIVAFGEYGYDG